MVKDFKPTFAFVVSVESMHGNTRIVAHPIYHNEAGEMRNPSFGRFEIGSELASFAVSAYIDQGSERPYGFFHHFAPYQTELEQAESIVKVLRKVAKALKHAETERGYVSENMFAEYIFRVAAAVGIKDYYIHNSAKGRSVSGEVWRKVDGTGVQYFISEAVRKIRGE
jgi:hypothetical protein